MNFVARPPKGFLPRVTQPEADAIYLRLHGGEADAVYELSDREAALLYQDLHKIVMRRAERLERALSQAADTFWVVPSAEG